MTDGIKVIQQTTAEREQETKDLWEQIKPLLDQGMIYSAAAKKVKKIPGASFNRYQQAWYKDLIAYGESQGYPYDDYSGKANNNRELKNGL